MDVDISEIFETRRGKRWFNINNYKFSEFCILKSGDSNYRCKNKKCSEGVIINKSNKVVNVTNTHNHEAYNNHAMAR